MQLPFKEITWYVCTCPEESIATSCFRYIWAICTGCCLSTNSSQSKSTRNSFQMNKIGACYSGLDSSTLTNQGKGSEVDFIAIEQDVITLHERPDMYSSLATMVQEGRMSEQQYADYETMIAHRTENLLGDDRDKCLFGSSYVALEDTVALYKDFKQTRQSVILVCKEPAKCGGRGSPWGSPQCSGRGGRR